MLWLSSLSRHFVRFIFSGKVIFFAKSVFSTGFSKFLALAFFQFKVKFVGKVGLVKYCGACKIRSKDVVLVKVASLPKPGHTNMACT